MMHKPAHKDTDNPPGQVKNDWVPPQRLGEIIDRVRRTASEWPYPESRLIKLKGEQPLEEWKHEVMKFIGSLDVNDGVLIKLGSMLNKLYNV